MRGIMLKILAGLLALCVMPVMPEAVAGPRVGEKKPKRSRPDNDKAYALEDIMKGPKEYLEREVFFYCRFATTSNLFKNVNTRFNSTEHTNFAVWPDKTVLWEEKGRKNVLPTLYIPKNHPELLEAIRTVKKYELIAVTGTVLNVYANYPWILVTKIERVELPSDRLCEPVVEHMQSGYDALTVNAGGVAARHFEQALQFGLPVEYRAKAYEQLARAYLLDNQLDKARDYLRLAVEQDPADPILNLALADVALRLEDPGEALAHCEFALERSGRHPQVYGIMGEARSLMGDYVKSFSDLNTAYGTPGITSREKAMINVRRARIYVRAGRYPDAARVYAAVSEPGEALAGEAWLHNEVGLFYEGLFLEKGDVRYLDSAYAAYEEASKLNRLDANILYNMTETEFRRQKVSGKYDFTLVKELIAKINQIEPEYTPARILEGRVLYAEGLPEEAEYRYQSVAGQIGRDAMALMALAEAYVELGRYNEAAAAAKRARVLQPWNIRIQAIGKYLERAKDGGPICGGQPGTCPVGGTAPDGVVIPQPGMEPQYAPQPGVAPQYNAPQYGAPQPGTTTYYSDPQQPGTVYYAEPQGAKYSQKPAPRQQEAPRPAQSLRPPAPATLASAPGSTGGTRPGNGIGVTSNGMIPAAAAQNYPQDIQASVRPAPAPGRSAAAPYPVTQVRLPEPKAQPTQSRSRNDDVRPVAGPPPLNLGFTPAANGAELYQQSEVGESYETGNPFIGQLPKSGEAYASIPATPEEEYLGDASDATRIPLAFSFAPDNSPVILADVRAPGEAGRDLPTRNANLYRRAGSVRQPAEIIEKEPVTPRLAADASVMAPPAGGVQRAEVKLPSSTQGIGMASDFTLER